jgi:predicted enzyme related to lactoylglutathione lyase
MKYREIAFVGYPVTDMARSREFYEGVLGLEKARDFGADFTEYDIGSGTLGLCRMDDWKPSKDGPSAGLEAENFDEVLMAVRSANVEFAMEPVDFPGCRMFVVRDPDGNMVTIHRRKDGRADA